MNKCEIYGDIGEKRYDCPDCMFGGKDNRQFKLEETQAPKTLPEELGTRAGNLGDVSGSATIQDENIIKEVIENMLKGIEEERQKDPVYKDMFKKSSDFGGLLHETENRMVSPILDACQILKDKFGINKIDNETYMFLLSLPILEHLIQKKIEETEGSCCCVDKTYILLSKLLKKKLNIKEE
jgi:hypothetical protein